MIDSLDKRGIGICKRRTKDNPLPVLFVTARDALTVLERELKKREISEINQAKYIEEPTYDAD